MTSLLKLRTIMDEFHFCSGWEWKSRWLSSWGGVLGVMERRKLRKLSFSFSLVPSPQACVQFCVPLSQRVPRKANLAGSVIYMCQCPYCITRNQPRFAQRSLCGEDGIYVYSIMYPWYWITTFYSVVLH